MDKSFPKFGPVSFRRMVQGESSAGAVWEKDANAVILRAGLIISRVFHNQYLVNLVEKIQSSFKLFGDNVSCQDEKFLLTHD